MYYATKSVILVFGGYRFRIDSVMPSDALYSLDLNSRKWSILQPLPRNEVSFCFFFSLRLNSQRHKDTFCSLNVSAREPVLYLAKTGMCR